MTSVSIRVCAACALAAVALLTLGGCCPGGDKVLLSLTLTEEELAEDCYLKPLEHASETSPLPVTGNPMVTTRPEAKAFIGAMLLPLDDGGAGGPAASSLPGGPAERELLAVAGRNMTQRGDEVQYAYSAVYECEPLGPEVVVYAAQFKRPLDAEQRARMDANPMGVTYKGQLAAMVWSDGEVCSQCYERVLRRVERVLAK